MFQISRMKSALIQRKARIVEINAALERSPIVAILGPRQCGKTTLARAICEEQSGHYFDLEHPVSLARLKQPLTTLEKLDGLIVIDEIQRKPELFELLRVLADRHKKNTAFLILGSASIELIKNASESLAGRVAFVDLNGFDLVETGPEQMLKLWTRGGFPDIFCSKNDASSLAKRNDFLRTFLERDIPQLGISVPAEQLRRFWMMIAHSHGGIWKGTDLTSSLGISHPTAKRYLDILTGTFMIRQLAPWFENVGKRIVKSPKVYIRDSGILHTLLNIDTMEALEGHPKLGSSWEGFAIEQIIRHFKAEKDAFFWATHAGAELDLFLIRNGKRLGFEIKYSDAPTTTKSMHIVLENLKLDHLYIVYPGSEEYDLTDKIKVIPLPQIYHLA